MVEEKSLSLKKKVLFSTGIFLFFFVIIEVFSSLIPLPPKQQPFSLATTLRMERSLDWLQEDPLLLWRLKTPDPRELVFPDSNNDSITSEVDGTNTGKSKSGKPRPKKVGAKLGIGNDGFSFSPRSREKKTDRRIICLGDSCTFFGNPSYPSSLESQLSTVLPGQTWEVINAGVPAYSSLQGLLVLEHYLLAYNADYVTVFFGWNDHWFSHPVPDKELTGLSRSNQHRWGQKALQRLQFYQLLTFIIQRFRSFLHQHEERQLRVSLSDYSENLSRITEKVRSRSGTVLFITAPWGFDEKKVPAYLAELDYFSPLDEVISTHQKYCDGVRRLGFRLSVPVIDAEKEFLLHPQKNRLFRKDGIHFTTAGSETLANMICQQLVSLEENGNSIKKLE